LGDVRVQHGIVDGERSAVDQAKAFEAKERRPLCIREIEPVSPFDKGEI
jgi:hypothetical protein